MRRREFIAVIAGTAVIWPVALHAQQGDRLHSLGVLSFFAQDDPQGKIYDVAFRKRLNALGWVEGRNLEIQPRWAAGDLDRVKVFAKELTALSPEVLLGITTPATAALQHETRTIPILFAAVSDPIGSGFVKSLSNPGGNITGYMFIEASLASKWPDLMHAIAPQVSRIGLLFNPATAPYARYYIEKFYPAAATLHVEAIEAVVTSTADIESTMAKFGDADAGLVVMPDSFLFTNRKKIISLAERYRLPTIYPFASFVAEGGLISYGADPIETFTGAATYVDRILKGAKPNDLPVQLPTRFYLGLNLTTAKALGISFPQSLLVTADEVIE
jgi:putative tryptophan/tyrosine transport system substrate-binding protein